MIRRISDISSEDSQIIQKYRGKNGKKEGFSETGCIIIIYFLILRWSLYPFPSQLRYRENF